MKILALVLLFLGSPAWATVYYVDGAVGGDGNAGTSEGAGNAWATIDNAMNSVAAGDTVYVKASATYSEIATMDTAGTSSAFITFIGYTSTPGDGGVATIDATGVNNGIYNGAGTTPYYCFENLLVQNADFYGWHMNSGYRCMFTNCHANSNGTNGFFAGGNSFFYGCTATGNGADGFNVNSYCVLYGCFSDANTDAGYDGSGTSVTYKFCIAKGNTAFGFDLSTGDSMFNCTIDGENTTNYGIDAHNAYSRGCALWNNIIYDCTTGLYAPYASNHDIFGGYNLFYSNGTDALNWDAKNQTGDVSGDPLFTDEDSDDYSLGASSPARNAGWDYSGASAGMDIGAVQSQDSGGSGRTIIVG